MKHMRWCVFVFSILSLCFIVNVCAQPIHVNISASGSNDGSTWLNAFTNLQDALDAAMPGNEIWVAAGRYVPGSDPAQSFLLREGVAVYGGFAGWEANLYDRDWLFNETVLSGDVLGDDFGFQNMADNIEHVVRGTNNVVLDGFTITGGSATNHFPSMPSGGGMINYNATNLVVANCLFIHNQAFAGGAVYNEGGNPQFLNCRFVDNRAYGETWAMGGAVDSWMSSPVFSNCVFAANMAVDKGGAVSMSECAPLFVHSLFVGNYSDADAGGAVYLGNCNTNNYGRSEIINCTFADNQSLNSDEGGALYFLSTNNATVLNCIFSDNQANMSLFKHVWIAGPEPIDISYSALFGGLPTGPYNHGTGILDVGTADFAEFWDTGNWDSPANYNPTNRTSRVYDVARNWATNSLVGYYLEPQVGVHRRFPIVENDANSLIVLGDLSGMSLPGVSYGIQGYHLQSTAGRYDPALDTFVNDAFDSICIDAGDPASDYSHEPDPNGGRINMGAYGGTPQASKSSGGGGLAVSVSPPTDITATTAWLNGQLLDTGGATETHVWFVLGTNDFGAVDTSLWPHVEYAGSFSIEGPLNIVVTNLVPNWQYFYRIFASNEFGTAWSDGPAVRSFWTLPEAVYPSAMDGFQVNVAGTVLAAGTQPDGGMIIGGSFTSVDGTPRMNLARLRPDGKLDEAFDVAVDGPVQAIVIQPDGAIVLGGEFGTVAGDTRRHIARLYPEGSIDTSFDPDADDYVYSLVWWNDMIIMGGQFTNVFGIPRRGIALISPDGDVDIDFHPEVNGVVRTIAVRPDGRILLGGLFDEVDGLPRMNLARLYPGGMLDEGFVAGTDGRVNAIALQPNGSILLGGQFSNMAGIAASNIGRLNSSGVADGAFNVIANGEVNSLLVQANGGILVGGQFTEVNSNNRRRLARLHPSGTLDMNFIADASNNTEDAVHVIHERPDGKILVGGQFMSIAGMSRYNVALLYPDSTLDHHLNVNVAGAVNAVAVQPDGRIIIGGEFMFVHGQERSRIARIMANGMLDMAFTNGANNSVLGIAIQDDGRILVGGFFDQFGGITRNKIARLNPDGSLDMGFTPVVVGTEGVRAIHVLPDGKILIGGLFESVNGETRNNLAMLNSDGTLDATFTTGANDAINAITFDHEGGIILGGLFAQVGGEDRPHIARLSLNGDLDTSFNPGASDEVYALATLHDGKILVSGAFTNINTIGRNHIARIDDTGNVDAGFVADVDGMVRTMAIDNTGRIVIGGMFSMIDGQPRSHIARLLSDGTLDMDFVQGANGEVRALLLQPDGKILAGGSFGQIGGVSRQRFARLTTGEAAFRELVIPEDGQSIALYSHGAGPAFYRVVFEQSTDGTGWSVMGEGEYIDNGWEMYGINLPKGIPAFVRARGYYRGGRYMNSASYHDTVKQYFLRPLTLHGRPPMDVMPDSAVLRGELAHLGGGSMAEVVVVWGENDYGTTDIGAWPNSQYLGLHDIGPLSHWVSGLIPASGYYYRFHASNDMGEAWSQPPVYFETPLEDVHPYFKVYGIPDAVMVGTPQTVTVEAWFGDELMVNYTGTVQFASLDATTVVPGDYQFQPTDNGVRIFTNAVIFNNVDVHHIEVRDYEDPGMFGAQYGIFAYGGYTDTAEALMIWNHPSRSYTGELHSVSLAAVDHEWNLATNYTGTVSFSSSDPVALLPESGTASYSFSAMDGGWRTFTNDLQFNTVGIHWLRAQDDSNPDLYDVQHDLIAMGHGFSTQVTHLVVSGSGVRRTEIGISNSFEVTAHNEFEQRVESFTGWVEFTSTDLAAEYPASYLFEPADKGFAWFHEALIFHTPGIQSITATWNEDTLVNGTREFDVEEPWSGPGYFRLELPRAAIPGRWESFTVRVFDGAGNLDVNYTGEVIFWSEDASADVPANYTFTVADGGVRTFTNALRFSEAGMWMVSVQDSITGMHADREVYVVAPGATNTTHFEVRTPRRVLFTDENYHLLVVAKGEGGLVNTNHVGQIEFSAPGAMFMHDPFDGWVDGIAMISNQVQFTTAGSPEITVSLSSDPNIQGSVSIEVLQPFAMRFVDPLRGSDANSGAIPTAAWKTLEHAMSQLNQGEALIMAGGAYLNDALEPAMAESTGPTTAFISDPDGRYFGRGGEARLVNDMGEGIGLVSGQYNLLFYGLEFSGMSGATGFSINFSQGIRVYDCEFVGSDIGIDVANSSMVVIDGGFAEFTHISGIRVSESENVDISNMHIFECGNGIEIFGPSSSQTVIRDNYIGNNMDNGVLISGASALLQGNEIRNNYGAGVQVFDASDRIDLKNNLIVQNDLDGVFIEGASTEAFLINNTIAENLNGLLAFSALFVELRNNIVAFNSATGVVSYAGTTSNSYNCVYGNTGGDWDGAAPDVGDISEAPLFAGDGDYHLMSTAGRWTKHGYEYDAMTSPCIDAGDPGDPFDQEPDPNGGRINMGAFGNTREASLSPAPMEYDITATTGMGGSIAPSGTVWVIHGGITNFVITPDFGYHIADVEVNALSIGPTNEYTFVAVTNGGQTIHAVFALNEYTVTYLAGPGGWISGIATQFVEHGSDADMVEAMADSGYHFVQWDDGVTTEQRTDASVTNDITVTAQFALNEFDLIVEAIHGTPDPAIGVHTNTYGTVLTNTVDAIVLAGTTQYVSTGWVMTGNEPLSGITNSFEMTVTNNAVLTWQWATNYWLEVTDDLNGSVDVADGWYAAGTNLWLTATPSNGYVFAGWTGDVIPGYENENPLEIFMDAPKSLTPSFTLADYDITASASVGGSVIPEGEVWVTHGSNMTFTITPESGYHIEDVVVNGTSMGVTNEYTFVAVTNGGQTIHATFAINEYTVTYLAGPGGWISGIATQVIEHGSGGVSVEAMADPGYQFVQWDDGVLTASRIDEAVTIDITVTAEFALSEYELEVISAHGTIEPAVGTHTNTYGAVVTNAVESFIIDGSTQYVSTGWVMLDHDPLSGITNSFEMTVTNNAVLTWQWATNYWLEVTDDLNGSVDVADGWYAAGTNLWLTATPSNGYVFAGWTGDVIPGYENENPLEIFMDAPKSLTPSFTLADYDITATASAGGSIVPEGEVWVTHGSNMTFTITPDTGYHIEDVVVNGLSVGPTNEYTFVAVTNGGQTIHAVFALNEYTVTYLAGPGGWISGIATQVIEHGSGGVMVEALADPGYQFVQWDDGVLTAQRIDEAVTNDITVTAEFALSEYELEVESEYGNPTPVVGVHTNAHGTPVNATVDAVVPGGGSTRHVNMGWDGSGSVPLSGASNSVSFVLEENSSLTWLWQTEYWLEVGASANGSADVASQWVSAGSNITLNATPDSGYVFTGWWGNVDPAQENDNPLTILMDQPRTIVPQFEIEVFEGNVQVTIIPPAAVAAGAQWRLTTGPDTSWQESGAAVTVPSAGSPYTITFQDIAGWTRQTDMTGIEVIDGVTTNRTAEYLMGDMVLITGGTFQMGLSATTEGHPVEVSDFYLDVRPVSIGQFMDFATATGITMPPPPTWGGNTNLNWGGLDPDLPMVNVTWNQAKAYADWAGKRLPTEAEYEYAMRSGFANQVYPWGNAINAGNANYGNNVGQPTVPGTYPISAYGLYDIAGNVWQWCSDWHAYIPAGGDTLVNPAGPGSGSYKIIRGGSFITWPSRLESARRFFYTPDTRSTDLGFRCAANVPKGAATTGGGFGEKEIPEWWEEWHFGDGSGNEKSTGFDPDADSDSDGMTDGEEFLAGTDPNDPDCVLAMESVTLTADGIVVEWQSVAGRSYTLQRSGDLMGGFESIATGIAGTPPLNSYLDQPEGDGPWFYRVVVD